jgi:hypothetical protein
LGRPEVDAPGIARRASFVLRVHLKGERIAHLRIKLHRVTVDRSDLAGTFPSLGSPLNKFPQDLLNVCRTRHFRAGELIDSSYEVLGQGE